MKFLGFYIGGHDSNVSLADDNGVVRYFKLERIIQSKHKKGSLEWVKKLCSDHDFKPDYVCFSDGNRNNLGICKENQLYCEIEAMNDLFPVKSYCLDHHYAHILSCWPIINDFSSIQYGICVDGRGDHQVKCSVITKPFDITNTRFLYTNKESEYCLLFNKIGKLMNLSGGDLDFAGKIMGAHAYGHENPEYIALCQSFLQNNSIADILSIKYESETIEEICIIMNEKFFNWLASIHFIIGKEINNIFEKYIPPDTKVVYSGGGAQNTVFNEMLRQKYNIIIPPHCYDGGISLGCIKFLSSFFGQTIDIPEFPFANCDEDVGYADPSTIEKVINHLKKGKIVGWCQGKSEIGPRALGHRSILMDPSIPDGKNILNSRVKKREPWRPFAASILEEDAEIITGQKYLYPYMLHAVKVKETFHKSLKSVVHIDGTCRFQTVGMNSKTLNSFYQLIKNFKRETGVPGILNTSYNMAGMPIANSRKNILEAFKTLDLDVLCLGNEIITK